MKNTLTLILLIATLSASCTEITQPVSEYDYDKLYRSWTHSYEEQTNSILIFRPSEYKQWAPSWYRAVYEFRNDGTCTYLVLASNDAHYFETGTWSVLSEDRSVIRIINNSGEEHQRLRLVELREDLLRVLQEYDY